MTIVIAEEVEAVLPELVVRSAIGEVVTMQYHVLPSLLLAEVQRLEKERAAMAAELTALREARRTQAAELAELRSLLKALVRR